MFKRQQKSASSSASKRQSVVESKTTSNKTRHPPEPVPKKPNERKRRSLGSRVSVHSLLFPAAYTTISKDVKQPMSRSVNDLQHTTVSSDQSGDSSSDRDSVMNSTPAPKAKLKECPLCFIRQPSSSFPQLTCCTHQSCRSCLVQYLQMEILESRVHVTCPECSEMLHPNDIYRLLCDHRHLVEKYEEFSVRRVLMTDPDTRWCPAPDCSYAVIATGCAACPELKCDRPGCNTLFCYHCKMTWHPSQTCNEARAQRGSFAASPIHIDTTIRPGDIKACPRCQTYIVKMNDGSCNHMICALCGAEFCWLCLKEISDLHYLSPSGCTFWGKKPWSRKKKLLWQLGMLVGAPVGIALVAGLAVPAIMFGVPVWIGRKVHQKLKDSTKFKRRLAVISSVLGSILMGPVLATMAVGVGVPIMLAYVYGVVPLSLCRNGSCGVTASPSGVKLDLDAEILAMSGIGDNIPFHEKTQLLSNVDKTDASTVASMRSGSTTTQHKMQVHAEVLYTKRRPSIESGATSLGERVNYEDASVKALAGSTYYDDKSVHTMGSLAEGGSYCEDQASTKALAGSVICPITSSANNNGDTKSLCGAKSVCSGITSGGMMMGDNASVRGLAGSICSGVLEQPMANVSQNSNQTTASIHCSRCHKPLHHVTLHVIDLTANQHEDCQSMTAATHDDWRKLSGDSRHSSGGGVSTLENRITKFADQLSVESYDIGNTSSIIASNNFADDDDTGDSNMLLGGNNNGSYDRRSLSRSIDKLSLSGKKSLEPPCTGSRHLTAINEIYHACRRSLIQTVEEPQQQQQPNQHNNECLCDDGDMLLLAEFGAAVCQQHQTSKMSTSSWKFLKKSRSWSAKLDASRTTTTGAPAEPSSSVDSQCSSIADQPGVHFYKKHPSTSWKLRVVRRSGVPPSSSFRSESKSTKLSNSYTSLPDINQQKRQACETVKRDRRGQLATTLTNFFKVNNNNNVSN